MAARGTTISGIGPTNVGAGTEARPYEDKAIGATVVTPMLSRVHDRAFTLIELVVVLVVLTVTIAITAPSLRGWSQGAKLRDAGQQLLAATAFARSQAAATATPHRLIV